MAIARNLRIYPLSLKTTAAYSLNNGIVSAYDYAGDPANAYAGGDGVAHVGSHNLTKDAGANFPVVTVAPGVLGRDISQGKTAQQAYRRISIGGMGFGSADGKSSFTLHHCYRAPSSFVTSGTRVLSYYGDGIAAGRIALRMAEHADGYVYTYWTLGGVEVPSAADRLLAKNRINFNAIGHLHLTREGDTVTAYVNGVAAGTVQAPNLTVYNTPWTGVSTGTQHGFTGATNNDLIFIDQTVWNRNLSGPEVAQHYNDPYAGYNNTAAVTPGIKINGPVPNDTVSSEGFDVSVSWSGSTVPTSIQARFNGGTWNTIIASPTGGSGTGTMPAVTAATGPLEVRFGNSTAITDSITITAAPPVPTVGLVSQDDPDGQSLTLQVSVQRVNSLTIDLVAIANGAIAMSHTLPVTYSTTAANVSDTFDGIAPGDYSVSIKGTNASGDTIIGGNTFTILGVGGGGSGPGDAPAATLPGAPTDVAATAGNGFILASFTAPASNGGAEITEYRITASTGQMAVGEASPIRVNIPNGTSASVTAAAKNTVGYGPESTASAAVTPAPTAPDAPRSVSAQAISGAMVITFLPPLTDGGSPITSYIATSSNGDTATSSSSPIVIDSNDGVPASAVVRAVNAIGPGPDSSPSNTVTPSSPPGAPTILSVLARNGYVLVDLAPPEIDGGFSIDGYRITASTGQTADGVDMPIRIDLPRDVPVTITAMAYTNAGYGEASEPSASVTPRAPFVRFTMVQWVNGVKVPVPNLSGLRFAWFDQPTLDLIGAPTDKGATETTDANGEILIPLPGSSLWTGDIGRLEVSNDTGNPALTHSAFAGPVVVE